MKKAVEVFHYDLAITDRHVENNIPRTFAYCANVHDEQQFTTAPENAERIGELFCEAISQAAVRLDLRCPLSGTYSIGNNWKETH
jgi:DNA polymerase I-like protein with 3'-5' exonuclease and polymerase domains